MSLRLKSFAIIAACMVVLMAMLYGVFHYLVTTRFIAIEEEDTRLNVARVKDAIAQELVSLNSKTGDWANWDDIYSFVQGENAGFITTNVVDGTFEELQINLMLVVAPDGKLVYGGSYDLDAGGQALLPEGILAYLTPDSPLLQRAAESGELTGLVNLPNGPLLVASRPILTTAGEGPSAGTLIFGRYLDAAEQTQLAGQTHLSLQFRLVDDPCLPGDFEAAAKALRLDPAIHVAALSQESIAGYDMLEDIQGEPALLLRIDAPRPVYQQGQAILLSFGLVILVMGLLAAVIIGVYQQRLLLSRLEKAEDRHRAVVEQTAEAFLLIDPEDMLIIDANRAFYRLFGFSPQETAKLTLYDLDSGSRREIDAAWRLACQGDQQSSSPRQWRHHDGHVLDVEMGASQITLGKRKLMSCVVRDVSERRKTEQALRSSEERFRGVFENTLIGIYQIAPDGRVLYANRALALMLGFRTPEDMVQVGLDQYDGSANPGRSLRRRIDEAGEIRGHVSSWKKSNGNTTRTRENARAVRDPSGAVRYYEGTVEDITELVEAQEELQRRARYLEALNNVIAAGGTASDAPGMMNACLDSTLKALGLSVGAVWAGGHQRFVGLSDDFSTALDGLESAFDKTIYVADGSEIPPGHPLHSLVGPMARSGISSWLAFPVMSEGKRIGGLALASTGPRVWRVEEASLGEAVASQLGAGMDRFQIAEQTQHQERLAAVGQLAAGIAHDFNNVLAAIMLHAGLLMKEPGLPPRSVGRTKTILEQGQYAASLVSQVLDFSRRSLLQMQPVDLLQFLKEKLKLVERTLPETIRPELIAEKGEYPLQADVSRIQQVLINLSTNARDAMPNGGRLTFSLRRISVAPEDHRPFPDMPAGDWLVLGVTDTGIGMPDEVKSHLFEPFFTTKAPGKGTGLGLSQVYGIVKQHGGYVDVSSTTGIGTTFTIFFPPLAAGTAEEALPAAGVGQGNGETLLLVEDQEATREAITDVLEGLGYSVICAGNGREALKLFQEHADRIQLVISDMVMPELGGQGLYEELVQRRPGLRMIIMTGYPVGGTGQLWEAKGVVRLQKPMTADVLAAAVRAALESQPGDSPKAS